MNSLRARSVFIVLSCALFPSALRAQFTAGASDGDAVPGWAPAAVGVRVGFDNAQSEPTVGAMVRIPVLPSGSVEILPNLDVTFFDGFKIYQFNFEAVYLTQGRRGGLYAGGGMGFREGIFSADPNGPRSTQTTFSFVAGLRFGGLGRVRPELETRWIFQEEQVRDPRLVTFGVSLALW